MLSRETRRSSFGIVGDRVLFGVGHATALHSGRPRDILCGTPTLPARKTFGALQEFVAYAFEESVRIKKKGRLFPGWHKIPVRSSHGILQEVQSLLQRYRRELVRQSRLLDQGGCA